MVELATWLLAWGVAANAEATTLLLGTPWRGGLTSPRQGSARGASYTNPASATQFAITLNQKTRVHFRADLVVGDCA